MRLPVLIGAALLAASATLHAQVSEKRRFDCSQAKDPKACEERVAKGKEAYAKAQKACEGKPEAERRDCMRHERCAQAKDPAQCEARAKQAMAQREKIREACKDKQGEDRRACIREQRGKL